MKKSRTWPDTFLRPLSAIFLSMMPWNPSDEMTPGSKDQVHVQISNNDCSFVTNLFLCFFYAFVSSAGPRTTDRSLLVTVH